MKFNYKLARQCGATHGPQSSNLVFDAAGTTVLSATHNRVQAIDLTAQATRTLPFEARSNVRALALSPDDCLLVTVDDEDRAQLINYRRGVVLHRFRSKKRARCVSFSPDGAFLAVGHGRQVRVWRRPAARREFAPLRLHRTYVGPSDDVTALSWSRDSTVLIGCARDRTARLWTVETVDGRYVPVALGGHRGAVVGAWLDDGRDPTKSRTAYTLSEDGALFEWAFAPDDDDDDEARAAALSDDAVDFFTGGAAPKASSSSTARRTQAERLVAGAWSLKVKHRLDVEHRVRVTAADYSSEHSLLVAGLSNGTFSLRELPSFAELHALSVCDRPLTSVRLDPKAAEWIAAAAPGHNALLVWEWRSETYVVKQRGHAAGVRCFSYSPDGVCIATGGEDGAVKLWSAASGFCFVTLPSPHNAPVSGVAFSGNAVLLSAGLDGVVHAHDLRRYRRFRTYAPPTATQLTCVDAVDGDLVVAGSRDGDFSTYVWDLRATRLTEVLSGHEGPITAASFSPNGAARLATASWDGTVRVRDLCDDKRKTKDDAGETLRHDAEVVATAWRPDGKALCASTLRGTLVFWDVEKGTTTGEIHGRRDIAGGRKENDRMTADNNSASRYFTSVCYSADGTCVLAGGNSKYVCIYEVSQKILLKKFQISFNRSLDGTLDELNSKNLTDGGPAPPPDDGAADEHHFAADAHNVDLPGAKRLDDGTRRSKQEVLTRQVGFSSTGREFAVVSTEGLHVFSLDEDLVFDPVGLTGDVTPQEVRRRSADGRHDAALRAALSLNERSLVRHAIGRTPFSSIARVVRAVPPSSLDRLLGLLARIVGEDGSPHAEFHAEWCAQLLEHHAPELRRRRGRYARSTRALSRALTTRLGELRDVGDENGYELGFWEEQARLIARRRRETRVATTTE